MFVSSEPGFLDGVDQVSVEGDGTGELPPFSETLTRPDHVTINQPRVVDGGLQLSRQRGMTLGWSPSLTGTLSVVAYKPAEPEYVLCSFLAADGQGEVPPELFESWQSGRCQAYIGIDEQKQIHLGQHRVLLALAAGVLDPEGSLFAAEIELIDQ